MMMRRQCKNCRHFVRANEELCHSGEAIGECRIRSVPQDDFPKRKATDDCGEWQDGRFMPEQHEWRETVRQFALAIVQGWYASDASIGPDFPKDAWKRAREIVQAEKES